MEWISPGPEVNSSSESSTVPAVEARGNKLPVPEGQASDHPEGEAVLAGPAVTHQLATQLDGGDTMAELALEGIPEERGEKMAVLMSL